jgi:hypothetical protein
MSGGSDIGVGDIVECVVNRLPTTLPPRGLVVGSTYRVTAVGVTPRGDSEPGVPWVRLAEVAVRPDRWGFRASWFKHIYRPRADLIESLLHKASEPERVES